VHVNRGVVAVMQPYFFPYAGYYRLLAAAETFVVFDDAQFTRRGRVHRCEVPGPSGAVEWLTLPLERQPQSTAIRDLRFAANARETFDARLARLSWLRGARGPLADSLLACLSGPFDSPCAFVTATLRFVAEALELPARIVLASELAVAPTTDRVERIAALVRAVGGREYLNAPGGRALYTADAFAHYGLALRFLDPYTGRYPHMASALAAEDAAALRADVMRGLAT
jgi:hypothetical protein